MALAQYVLRIGLDDVGQVDIGKTMAALLASSAATPRTPNIDALMSNGIWFARNFSNMSCGPTRANWLTARHGFRTKVTAVIEPDATDGVIRTTEITLPECLKATDIDTALFGKWHLSDAAAGGDNGPILAGFNKHDGTRGNIAFPDSYTDWERIEDGVVQGNESTYATTYVVDQAIAWINGHSPGERWYCDIQFNAPHAPFHRPPDTLHTFDTSPEFGFNQTAPLTDEFPAMMEALDTELGRLLGASGLDLAGGSNGWTYANTLVIVQSDNGTPGAATREPIASGNGGSKGTGYWSGICVPMGMRGAGVVGTDRRIDAVSSAVDMLPTICDVMGVNHLEVRASNRPMDGVSLVPLMQNTATSVRDYAFAERRNLPPSADQLPERFGIAGTRLLLVRNFANVPADELYDMETDPQAAVNLLDPVQNPSGLTPTQQSIMANLSRKLVELQGAAMEQPVSVRF